MPERDFYLLAGVLAGFCARRALDYLLAKKLQRRQSEED